MKRLLLPLTLAVVVYGPSAPAQDGKVLYEQLCGACHGNDGKGGQDGQHPPLADSAWIKGAPDRMIQVVLHGLMGEIRAPSKHAASATYDLVMPPQGAIHTDVQIAKILTYVRSSWGNQEGAVTEAMVREQREATKDRNGFWMAEEILKRHPLGVAESEKPVNPGATDAASDGLPDKPDPPSS
jgi:mono/diheme cytochrome c family protein